MVFIRIIIKTNLFLFFISLLFYLEVNWYKNFSYRTDVVKATITTNKQNLRIRLHHSGIKTASLWVIMWQHLLLNFCLIESCSLSGSNIFHNMSDARFPHFYISYCLHLCCLDWVTLMHAPIFTCADVAQLHWPKLLSHSVTSASEDDVVFLLFFVENNFHSRRHRKVATRHTLPKIQRSLSLRKFSMMEAFLFLFLSPLSACTGCPSYFRLFAGLGGWQQDVDKGRGSRPYLWNS